MSSNTQHVVVMGVSGTGKTSVGQEVARRLDRVYVEGDDLHPPTNVAKMSAGTPLDDDDRAPWLAALGALLAAHHADDVPCVLTCSALKRAYRDVLRADVPPGSVFFVHLTASVEVLQERMESREHFMPASLLQSQLDTLQPLEADEDGMIVDVAWSLDDVVAEVLAVPAPLSADGRQPCLAGGGLSPAPINPPVSTNAQPRGGGE